MSSANKPEYTAVGKKGGGFASVASDRRGGRCCPITSPITSPITYPDHVSVSRWRGGGLIRPGSRKPAVRRSGPLCTANYRVCLCVCVCLCLRLSPCPCVCVCVCVRLEWAGGPGSTVNGRPGSTNPPPPPPPVRGGGGGCSCAFLRFTVEAGS